MFFRRRVDLFNPLLAAGKEALWTALVLMIVLVGRAAWAQNQPPFVLVEVGPIAPVFGASSVLNPVTNKFYTNGVDGIHVLNLSTKSSTVPGTFGDNLQTWGPLAVNPVKNHIYVPVYDRGLFVIDGDTDTPTDIVVIPKMKPVSAIAVNSLNNQLFVATSDGTFRQIDAESGTILATTTLPQYPESLAVNERDNVVYVGYLPQQGQVGMITAVTSTIDSNNHVILSTADYAIGAIANTVLGRGNLEFNPLTNKVYYQTLSVCPKSSCVM
jgi:hypothetical protein